MNRNIESNSFESVNESYRAFIGWLFEFIFTSLHLDSTFAKRNQLLTTMSTFLEMMGGARCMDEQSKSVLFDFVAVFEHNPRGRERLFSLIECLWDTYEINKDVSLELLDKLDTRLFRTLVRLID